MHDDSGEADLVARLRSLGEHPVDEAVAQRVLSRARRRGAWLASTKLKVAAAFAGGFLVGGVGLASAGTLPAPAQDVAHSALGAVGIGVPPGHDRYDGPECGGTYANHGQYVRAHKGDPNAGRSPCGKPMRSIDKTKTTTEDGASSSAPEAEDAGGHGPPPWAGKGNKDKAAKADGAGEDETTDDDRAARTPETTPSTIATTTTTTEPPSTTTTTEPPTTTSEVTTTTTVP